MEVITNRWRLEVAQAATDEHQVPVGVYVLLASRRSLRTCLSGNKRIMKFDPHHQHSSLFFLSFFPFAPQLCRPILPTVSRAMTRRKGAKTRHLSPMFGPLTSPYIQRVFADRTHSLRLPRGGRSRDSRDQLHNCKFPSQAIPFALVTISLKRNDFACSILPDHYLPRLMDPISISRLSPRLLCRCPSPAPSPSSI